MPAGKLPSSRYAVAALCAALAFAGSTALSEAFVRVAPFLLFYAAVGVSSWYGGAGPGLLVTGLGALAVAYFLVEPGHLTLPTGDFAVRLLLFLSLLSGQLRAARARCEVEAARASRLASADLVGVCFADLDGPVSSANDAFLRVAGRGRDELARPGGGLDWRALTAPEHRHIDERAAAALREGRTCPAAEKELLRGDGRRVPVAWGCALLDGSDRECVHFVLDLTELKRAEAQLSEHEQRLRAMASELMLAEERERRRIATVLHDSVGHALALAKLRLRTLRQRGQAEGPEAFAAAVDGVQSLVAEAVEHARSLTVEISPPVLYELGLAAALQWLGERLQQQHGIRFDFEDDGLPKPVTAESRIVLFQAARELLVNVAKHAGARSCAVTLARDGGRARLAVEDDGRGIGGPPGAAARPAGGGFGLFSIRERVEFLGGGMDVGPAPGGGARVALWVPLDLAAPKGDDDEDEDPPGRRPPDDARRAADDARRAARA